MAQTMLSFQSVSGERMVVTRNMQLIVKKTTRTFKTLEGSLAHRQNNGERRAISTRVAELSGMSL